MALHGLTPQPTKSFFKYVFDPIRSLKSHQDFYLSVRKIVCATYNSLKRFQLLFHFTLFPERFCHSRHYCHLSTFPFPFFSRNDMVVAAADPIVKVLLYAHRWFPFGFIAIIQKGLLLPISHIQNVLQFIFPSNMGNPARLGEKITAKRKNFWAIIYSFGPLCILLHVKKRKGNGDASVEQVKSAVSTKERKETLRNIS